MLQETNTKKNESDHQERPSKEQTPPSPHTMAAQEDPPPQPERLSFYPYNIIKAHLLGLLGLLAFVGFYGTKTPERMFQIKSGARDEGLP